MTELHGKIYLTKADMPKGCNQCPFCNGADECMVQNEDSNFLADTWDDLRRGCPLEEIEPVTVQEWISVKDRLPEIVSTHKQYRSTVKKSIRVLCVCVQKSGKRMVKEGYCEWYNDYPEPRWQIPGTIDDVTHWQYLPQPPKGE